MAKFTAVYADFSQRLIEVEVLRRQAVQFERSRQSFRHGPEIKALCRGAVVLLSSHIEGYIKELGEHTLDSLHAKSVCRSKFAPQFFYHISQEAIGPIRDSSKPAVIAQHLQTFVSIEAPFGATSIHCLDLCPQSGLIKVFRILLLTRLRHTSAGLDIPTSNETSFAT